MSLIDHAEFAPDVRECADCAVELIPRQSRSTLFTYARLFRSEVSTSLIVKVPLADKVPSSATVPVLVPPITGASSAPLMVMVTAWVEPSEAVKV